MTKAKKITHKNIAKFLCLLFLICLIQTINGCGNSDPHNPQMDATVLRISALPDQAPEAVFKQHEKLIQYICKTLAVTCQWHESTTYESLVDDFGQGKIDLAYFGGATYIMAHEQYGAIPLVMRDIDTRFTSSLFVQASFPIHSLNDLQGHSFAFGPQHSTSGHIMPRYYLRKSGIEPEQFFSSIIYSEGHDKTLASIESGTVAAGIVNSHIAKRILNENNHSLQMIWETPPYVDYVWAIHPNVNEKRRQQLQDVFLGLRLTVTEERAILDQQGARGFLPANISDFKNIQSAFKQFLSERSRP